MKKSLNRGFTLIELLVVIAIIGILSGIVLTSLSTARNKANDAKVEGQLSSMRTAAEIYYGNNGNKYQTTATAITTCTGGAFSDATSNMLGLITSTQSTATAIDCGINAAGDAWSVAATLPSGSGYTCVDSTGASRNKTSGGTLYTGLVGASPAAHATAGAFVCN